MTEWIKFFIVAVFVITGIFAYASAVFGVCRYSFILNSLHCAGVGDTLGILMIVIAGIIYVSDFMAALKLVLVLGLMWFTSPVSSHLLSEITLKTASGDTEQNIEGREEINGNL